MLRKLSGSVNASRFTTSLDNKVLTVSRPDESLVVLLPKRSGRDNQGHISSHHIGGREKRYYRLIDFKRNKRNMEGRVCTVEYDPNRTVNIALVQYTDGQKTYVLHPEGLKVGEIIVSGENVEVKVGNALPLNRIPVGQPIHNIELTPGRGGQIVRSAGNAAAVLSKEGTMVTIKLPSGETRKVSGNCYATIGQLGNIDWRNVVIGKAGRSRHLGIRPKVRGTAQNPRSHPHGGGEGRSGEGLVQPKTPWGKRARGVRTRNKKKYSNKYIVQRRSK